MKLALPSLRGFSCHGVLLQHAVSFGQLGDMSNRRSRNSMHEASTMLQTYVYTILIGVADAASTTGSRTSSRES
jgi:hypothetical protein